MPGANALLLPIIVNSLPTELYKILNDQVNEAVGIADERIRDSPLLGR